MKLLKRIRQLHKSKWASQVALAVKKLPANAGDVNNMGLIPGLGRSPGGEEMESLSRILPWTEEPGKL